MKSFFTIVNVEDITVAARWGGEVKVCEATKTMIKTEKDFSLVGEDFHSEGDM